MKLHSNRENSSSYESFKFNREHNSNDLALEINGFGCFCKNILTGHTYLFHKNKRDIDTQTYHAYIHAIRTTRWQYQNHCDYVKSHIKKRHVER